MRILHCCLSAFYIDNYGYQENILPRIHHQMGHVVEILASTETFIENNKVGYLKPSKYFTNDGIAIERIPYVSYVPHLLARKLRIYPSILHKLEQFKPEVVFLHNFQFWNVLDIVAYAKNHKVNIIADSHVDAINSATSFFSREILHKIIYRKYARILEPYVTKFWGTSPLRNDFMFEYYHIPKSKIELLPLGADDSLYQGSERLEIRLKERSKLKISSSDFVIISGGKLDRRKNILLLINAFKKIVASNCKLVLFGSISDEMEDELRQSISSDKRIMYVSWLSQEEIYKMFFSADLAVFPGTHSVLWEQAVGVGLPCIFKSWKGIEHVKVGENCILLESVDELSIQNSINSVLNDNPFYLRMKRSAETDGIGAFSYMNIASKAINF